jgi:hypothetical protein
MAVAALTAALPALAAAGCGPKRPPLHRTEGAVTFAGRPVPRGVIVFDPDVTKGNRGPQGFALIKDGRYDTAAPGCRGTAGGAMVVRIDGSEPLPGAEDSTTADRPLFPTHEERVDLPAAAAERNFQVPARAAR